MKQPDLLKDPINRLFFKYLGPSISATLVTSIYILADTVMIGRGVGPIGIAALNLLLPLFSIYFGTGLLFGVGGGVLLSICKGRKDDRGAREYFTVALGCAVVFSLVYLIGSHVFFDALTRMLGKNETMETFVNEYGRILVSGAPVFVFSSFLQAFVRNDKAPKLAMVAVITGGISNVVLDYVFIFPMDMGMAGGAIATVLGSIVTVLILVKHFFSPANTLKPVRHADWKKAWEIFVNGLSSFLIDLSNGIIVFLFNRQLLHYVGDLGVVVYGIISNSALIVASVCNGISQAAQPLLATNFGAGRKERVTEAKRMGQSTAAAAGLMFLLIGLCCPKLITQAFVEPTAEILSMSVPAVRIYFISFLAMGLNILYSTYFQSVMEPACALIICLLRGMIFNSIFVFVLPMFFDVSGIWMTMAVTEFLTLLVGSFLIRKRPLFKKS